MVITIKDYLTSSGKYPGFVKLFSELKDQDQYRKNANRVLGVALEVCHRSGVAPIVTSGWRPLSHHLALYAARGVPKEKVPMGSAHLTCQAIDIWDPERRIGKWLRDNKNGAVAEINIFFESLDSTQADEDPNKRWVHIQTKATPSGNREFIP